MRKMSWKLTDKTCQCELGFIAPLFLSTWLDNLQSRFQDGRCYMTRRTIYLHHFSACRLLSKMTTMTDNMFNLRWTPCSNLLQREACTFLPSSRLWAIAYKSAWTSVKCGSVAFSTASIHSVSLSLESNKFLRSLLFSHCTPTLSISKPVSSHKS